MVKFGKKVTF
jgi:hypothetical protein